MVGGGSMLVNDLAPYCISQGDRAVVRGLNLVGLRRAGLKKENIRALRDAYRIMFQSKMTIQEALASVDAGALDPYAKIFFDFFREPKRGYARPAGSTAEEEETTAV
jgi:UDP-N-acetylglucosamine acyltransferase